jgi:hypothetical protein
MVGVVAPSRSLESSLTCACNLPVLPKQNNQMGTLGRPDGIAAGKVALNHYQSTLESWCD